MGATAPTVFIIALPLKKAKKGYKSVTGALARPASPRGAVPCLPSKGRVYQCLHIWLTSPLLRIREQHTFSTVASECFVVVVASTPISAIISVVFYLLTFRIKMNRNLSLIPTFCAPH